MTTFPVSASTLSAAALGTFIIGKYSLDNNCTCELVRTGINHTYFISGDKSKYVLRVYSRNWRSRSDIQDELDLLAGLKNNNISISYPVADAEGNLIQAIDAPEGLRYAVLFSFAEGRKVRIMNEKTYAIGLLMAKIHKLTHNRNNSRMAYTADTLLVAPYKHAASFFPEELPEMQFLKGQVEEITQEFKQADPGAVTTGIIHMDIWYDNMSIAQDNKITLFDFDFCGNGWFVLDVAYFCKQLFHIETNKEKYELKIKSFLRGYQSVRKMSSEEVRLIPEAGAAVFIFYLGEQCRRLDWSNIFLSENYLKMVYVARIKSWLDYYRANKVALM